MVTLLIDDCELYNYDGIYTIYLVKDIAFKDKAHMFYAINFETNELRTFSLTESFEYITNTQRDDILNYCLSKVEPVDEVQIQDIFLHGKFIKEQSYSVEPDFKDWLDENLITK